MHLFRQSEPLYRELAERLRQELLAYRPGDYLPGEIQLAQRFAVNRHTLRRALDELVLEGRVLRRQGKGTQVLEAPTIYPMGAANAYTESLGPGPPGRGSAAGGAPASGRRRRGHPPGDRRGRAGAGTTTLRYLDGQPVSLIRHCYAVSAASCSPTTRAVRCVATWPTRPAADPHLQPDRCAPAQPRGGGAPADAPPCAVAHRPHPVRDRTGQPVELAQSISRADRFQYQVAPRRSP